MQKLLGVLTLIAVGAGCQPQVAKQSVVTSLPVVPAAATVPPPPVVEQPLPVLFTAADTLSGAMQSFLAKYDLSELWQGGAQHEASPALEGFFGPDHYRFTIVITKAQRSAQSPAIYQVQGKCRYRANIRPFTGTLTIRQLADAKIYYAPQDNSFFASRTDTSATGSQAWQDNYEAQLSQATAYTLRAQVQLTEVAAENSGIFEGEAYLNFYVMPPHKVGYAGAPMLTEGDPARGSSLLLRGARRNVTTRQVKQFVVADDVFAAAPEVYKDFGVGDRGQAINPKYAKLGWNTYWDNNEWWADAPKSELAL